MSEREYIFQCKGCNNYQYGDESTQSPICCSDAPMVRKLIKGLGNRFECEECHTEVMSLKNAKGPQPSCCGQEMTYLVPKKLPSAD